MLANIGAVVAGDVYVHWKVAKMGGQSSSLIAFDQTSGNFQMDALDPRIGCCLSKHTNRLAPGAVQFPIELRFTLLPPFTEGIEVIVTAGCAGAPPTASTLGISLSDLRDHFEDAVEKKRKYGDTPSPVDWQKVARKFFGIPVEALR